MVSRIVKPKLTRTRVLHFKMELIFPPCPPPKGRECKARKKKSNDQRKPSGYAIPVISFPLRITLPITPASNRAVKRLGVAKIKGKK